MSKGGFIQALESKVNDPSSGCGPEMGLVLAANQDLIVESPASAPVFEQDQRQCHGAIWAGTIMLGQYGDSPQGASRSPGFLGVMDGAWS
jgi:hypothetical protein